MKNLNFFEKLWEHSRTLRRVGLVLVMCLITITQAWAGTYTVVGIAADNPNDYDVKWRAQLESDNDGSWTEAYSDPRTATGITFEGKPLYVCWWDDWHNGVRNLYLKYVDGATEKTSLQFEGGYGWVNVGDYNHRVYNFDSGDRSKYANKTMKKGTRVYFDATGWSGTTIKLVTGHMAHQKYYTLSRVTNTKLYYGTTTADTWSDAIGWGVVSGTTYADGNYDDRINKVSEQSTEYTGWKNWDLNNNSSNNAYLCVNNGKAGEEPSMSYYSSHYSNGNLNFNQTVYYVTRANSGSSYSTMSSGKTPAQISMSSYKFSSGKYTSVDEVSPTAMSANGTKYSTSFTAARTATTTLTVSNIEPGYRFDGWYDAVTGGTLLESNTSYTYYPTATKNVYARFTKQYAFVEGRFRKYNSARNAITTTYDTDGQWDESSTRIPMNYDATNHLFYLYTYMTPAEQTATHGTGCVDCNPYFYIKASTSSTSLANPVSYRPSASAQQITGTGTDYKKAVSSAASDHSLRINSSDESGYVILYFDGTNVWYELDCSVTYKMNGGAEGADGSVTGTTVDSNSPYISGAEVTTISNGYSNSGYKFKWWNTNYGGTGEDFYVGEKFTISANTDLYAQWEQVASGWAYWNGNTDASSSPLDVTGNGVTMRLTKNNVDYNTGIQDYTVVSKYSGTTEKHANVLAMDAADEYLQIHFTDGSPINALQLGTVHNGTSGTKKVVVIYSTTADFSTGEHEEIEVTIPHSYQETKGVTSFSPSTPDKYLYARIYKSVSTAVYSYTGPASGGAGKMRIYSIKAQKGTACGPNGLAYETATVNKTYGDAAFTNTLTNAHSLAVSYSSGNDDVATVSSTGEVTIKGAGSTTITATWDGSVTYCAGSVDYTLIVAKADITPSVSYASVGGTTLTVGETSSGSPAISGNPGGGTVTYSSSDPSVASVDENTGVVTAEAAGTATITATIATTANYNGNTATAEFTVNAAFVGSSSINLEQGVLDNTKSWGYASALTSADIAYSLGGSTELDSLNDGISDGKYKLFRNYPYLGLKIKNSDSYVSVNLPKDKALNVKFGYIEDSVKVFIGDTEIKPSPIKSNKSNASKTYTLSTSGSNRTVKFQTPNGKAVVIKQIMVGESLESITLPAKITLGATTNGTISVDNTKVNVGSTVAITVTPSSGYELSTLAVTRDTTTNPSVSVTDNEFTMPNNNVTINATFVRSGYAITLDDHDNGSVAITDGSSPITSADEGETVYLEATPNTGYSFRSWRVTPTAGGEPISVIQSWQPSAHFTMPDEPVTVSATFTQVSYSIMPNSIIHFEYTTQVGDGEASRGYKSAHYGDVITLAQTSIASGYHLKTWGVTKTASGEPIEVVENQFTMPAEDVTVNPIVGKWYTVTFDANTGDEEDNPDPITQTAVDGAITMHAAPTKSGYTFVNWMIGGTTVAAGGSYTPPTDVTAYATWKENCAGGGGSTSLYKFQVKSSGITGLDALSSNTSLTTANYLSALSGGTLDAVISSAGDIVNAGDTAIQLKKDAGYLTIGLTTALQDGDIIKFRTYNNSPRLQVGTTYSALTDVLLNRSATNKIAPVTHSMAGVKTLYLRRPGSNTHFTYFEIIRPSQVLVYTEIKNDLSDANIGTSTLTALTTSDKLSVLTGATMEYADPNNSAGDVQIKNKEFMLNHNNAYVKFTLTGGNKLAQGDMIVINSSTNASSREFYIAKASDGTKYSTTSQVYTIPAESPLIGSTTLFVWRYSGSATNIKTFTIVRPGSGGGDCKYVTYDGNGAAGGYTNDETAYTSGATVTVATAENNHFTHPGYTFNGWNTQPDGNGTPYLAGSTFSISENTTLYAQWTPAVLTFTGAVDYDWTDPANWTDEHGVTPACVPTIEHDVIIDNHNVRLYGAYSEDRKGHAVANSIKIDKSKDGHQSDRLELWSRSCLIVKEGITAKHQDEADFGPTQPEDLSIQTDVLGNGVLICGAASDNTQATYEFYSKAWKSGKWYINQYVGIPVEDVSTSQYWGFRVFVYNPEEDAWANPTSSELEPFTAYNLLASYDQSVITDRDITGTLILPGTTGEGRKHTFTCGSRYNAAGTFDGDSYEEANGDYLFANSWTAPVDISSLDESDYENIEPSIYIFNAGYVDPAGSQREIGELCGQWSCFPFSASTYMENAVIPATQAFNITAKAPNATLTLDYKKHVYDPAVNNGYSANNYATRAPKRINDSNAPIKLKMVVRCDSTIADQLYIFERGDFSEAFDNGWDGRKIYGKTTSPQIYATCNANPLAVLATSNMDGTQINFRKGSQSDVYTISFEYNGETELYLIDLKELTSTLISNENTYEFMSETGDNEQRFYIGESPYGAPTVATGIENANKVHDSKVHKVLINDHIYIIRGGKTYSVDGTLVK